MENHTENKRENALEELLGLRELTPVVEFLISPCGGLFKEIPKSQQTKEIVEIAITKDGMCLGNVARDLITLDLCKKAIDQNGCALEYVPKQFLSAELCEEAIINNGCALKYVPEKWINADIERKAVEHTPHDCYYAPICYIPSSRLSSELSIISVQKCPSSIKDIKRRYMSKKLLSEALKRDGTVIKYVPEKLLSDDLIEVAYANCPEAWLYVPEAKRTNRLKRFLQKKYPFSYENEKKEINEKPQVLKSDICSIDLQTVSLEIPEEPHNETGLVVKKRRKLLCNFGKVNDSNLIPVYYISDIHLEFQLQPIYHQEITNDEIEKFICQKINEMILGINSFHSILLIAGDVAHSIDLVRVFYTCLQRLWHGKVIAVLGNHELWDGVIRTSNSVTTHRPLQTIINDYLDKSPYLRQQVTPPIFLENSLYICYKNQESRIINEDMILNSSDEDLFDVCRKSTVLILGGVGFSGLNQLRNAASGIYRNSVATLEEDRILSGRFNAVYKKMLRCAGTRRLIVLTHTPVSNWTKEPYNPDWIYINGHTHRNTLRCEKDGPTVLSDNQVGYTPKKWKLLGFTISGLYDPLEEFEDGIYRITPTEYAEFNRAHGIVMESLKSEGEIYALKRQDVYLFILKDRNYFSLLQGGRRHRIKNKGLTYYYENMLLYYEKVISVLEPYHSAIKTLSDEVKKFGADGTIHGCIVDISFLSHLYLNPYDGKITAYWATDICSREVYPSLAGLIEAKEPELNLKFLNQVNTGKFPLIEKSFSEETIKKQNDELVIAPVKMGGTEIYKPSKIMRAIQYMYDQKVIRTWNDDILTLDTKEPIENKILSLKV